MSAVVRAITKEIEFLSKECTKLRFHLMEDNPYSDLLQIRIELSELFEKYPGGARTKDVEFVRSIECLRKREKSANSRLKISKRLHQGDGMDRLTQAEVDLSELSSHLSLLEIRKRR